MDSIEIVWQDETSTLFIEGIFTKNDVTIFEQQWKSLVFSHEAFLVVDFADLEIEDGIAMACMIDFLKHLHGKTNELILKHTPQLLAHTLYRIGLLVKHSKITLFETRYEEPYG